MPVVLGSANVSAIFSARAEVSAYEAFDVTALEELRAVATLDLRIDYMKPATPGRDIIGHCLCHKLTRQVAFVRGTAYHDTPDDPIAIAAMTFMVGANRSTPPIGGRA